jgi:hypothetical protein
MHARQTKADLGEEQNRVDYYPELLDLVKDYLQGKVEYLVGNGKDR